MNHTYYFCVAGLAFSVNLPAAWSVSHLLPSFGAFRIECLPAGLLFSFSASCHALPCKGEVGRMISEDVNDMGHVRLYATGDGYRVLFSYGEEAGGCHVMECDRLFTRAEACINPDAPLAGVALTSMLRLLYSQAIVQAGGLSVHASCVVLNDCAYLFLGKSGTGKSTHARLWMQIFEGSSLLNDDNPVIRWQDGCAVAYGTPWSGKTPCYKNDGYPVGGMVRLVQAGVNHFNRLASTDAFIALLPSCSVIHQDARLQDFMCRTLITLTGHVRIGCLKCRPDTASARLCATALGVLSPAPPLDTVTL